MEDGLQPLAYRDTPLVDPSESTAAHVRAQWIRHCADLRVIAPPVSRPSLPDLPRSERPTILYLGALHLARKRVDHLLRAFREGVRRVPEAELVIAGDGPDRATLESMTADLPVSFAGFVSDEEKARLLARAWVFASPSLQEGFGITWIEAGYAGLPTVGYRVDGLDTVDDSCALLVAPGDVEALTQALVQVLTDASLRNRLSAGARANAARFDSSSASRAFLDVVEREIERIRG